MFRFANPQYLWLLLVVPCLVAVLWLMAYRRRRSLARFGNPELLRQLMPDAAPWRIYLKYSMQIAALVCLIFALARPQVGSKLKEQTVEGVEMMLIARMLMSFSARVLTVSTSLPCLFSTKTEICGSAMVFSFQH